MKRLFLLLFTLGLCLGRPGIARAQLIADVTDAAVTLGTPGVERAAKRAAFTFTSETPAQPFTGVAVQGFATGLTFTAEVRFETAEGWSPWADLYVVRSATDEAFLAAYRGTALRTGERFELRFGVDADAQVELVGAGVFDQRRDADYEEGPPSGPSAGGKRLDSHLVPPMMISRAEWDAAPFIGNPVPLARPSYDYITFHHAAGFGATTVQEGLQQVKAIQDFHQNGRGWSDIGYQFVMDQSGRLYQGRPFLNEPVPLKDIPRLVQGAHVGNNNTGNIGVCVLGCYHPPEGAFCQDAMTPAALDSLVTMFAFLSDAYGVPEERIQGHRDFNQTACPGDNNYAQLPTIRARVEDLVRTGNMPLGTASLAAKADAEGVVLLGWQFLQVFDLVGFRIERLSDAGTTVIYEGGAPEGADVIDAGVSTPGDLTYRLIGRGATGREQILAVAEISVESPEAFILAHNFPNPFQDGTTIRYFLEQDGIVTLAVYDVTGRRVAVLEDRFREKGRWYAHTFDGRGLPDGTYFYRIQVEGFAGSIYDKTRAVTLLR